LERGNQERGGYWFRVRGHLDRVLRERLATRKRGDYQQRRWVKETEGFLEKGGLLEEEWVTGEGSQ